MALKTFKPTTPSLRQLAIVDRSGLHKGKPFKPLTVGKSEKGGRNNLGRITVRFRGGGHKQSYRIVDFKRRKLDVVGKVERLEYDPNRTSFIALIKYADGEHAYIIAAQRLSVGDEVVAGKQVDVKPGNAMPLANIPVGTIVHNVEMKIGKGGAIARSAGTYAQIVGRDQGYVSLRLNSGEQRLIHGQCFALDRRRFEPGPHECFARQGGPRPLARPASPQPRRDHESGRPSARRRRGPHLRRPSSRFAMGQAHQGQEDPVQQADRQVHRRIAARAEEERLSR